MIHGNTFGWNGESFGYEYGVATYERETVPLNDTLTLIAHFRTQQVNPGGATYGEEPFISSTVRERTTGEACRLTE